MKRSAVIQKVSPPRRGPLRGWLDLSGDSTPPDPDRAEPARDAVPDTYNHRRDPQHRSSTVRELLSRGLGKKRYSLLVVDDLRAVRYAISKMLLPISSRLQTAANGLEATRLMEHDQGADKFDLIVLDIQMPILDGLSTIKKLREFGCEVPIIALTASDDPVIRGRVEQYSKTAFAVKPISQYALMSLVNKLLN